MLLLEKCESALPEAAGAEWDKSFFPRSLLWMFSSCLSTAYFYCDKALGSFTFIWRTDPRNKAKCDGVGDALSHHDGKWLVIYQALCKPQFQLCLQTSALSVQKRVKCGLEATKPSVQPWGPWVSANSRGPTRLEMLECRTHSCPGHQPGLGERGHVTGCSEKSRREPSQRKPDGSKPAVKIAHRAAEPKLGARQRLRATQVLISTCQKG